MKKRNIMTTEKLAKMKNDIKKKFGVDAKIFKTGGRWSAFLEDGNNASGSTIKEIREYVSSHSEELEDDDI